MPRKPLDSLEGTDAPGSCRGWVYHRRRLPHGECGVWGRAPEDESYDTFNSADFGHNYDKIPTNSADEPFFLLNRFFGIEGAREPHSGYTTKLAYDFEDFSDLISKASKINIAGVTLSSGSNRYLGLLQEALIRGATVNVIVADPESPAFGVIASRMGKHDSNDELREEWSQSLSNFEKLVKVGSKFELRTLPEAASWGIWEFDPGARSHAVFAEVYSFLTELDLCIATSKSRDSELSAYLSDEFQRLWKAAKPKLRASA